MSSEPEDASQIFAKMQELQKSIDESKRLLENRNSPPAVGYPPGHPLTRGTSRGTSRGYPRGRGFFRGRGIPRKPYRNMTLVMNQNLDSNSDNFVSKVSKSGLSLVNTKVYQSEQERKLLIQQKIMELKLDKLQNLKKIRIQRKLQDLSVKYDYCNRANIDGIEMAIVNDGIRLVPISFIEDQNYHETIEYEGYKYHKMNDGSYLRLGHSEIELKRYVVSMCDIFKNTNKLCSPIKSLEEKEPCRFYTRTGKSCDTVLRGIITNNISGLCTRGKSCKYTHNSANISICKEFLKNQCPNPNCPLSHKPTQFNSPACKFFLNGFCSNTNCLFTHKQESETARICRNFSIGGYCQLGKYCPLKHSFNCPDFVERHNCPRGKSCTLVHYMDGSNSYVNSSMEVVRNEDNDLDGHNFQALQKSLTVNLDSSSESEEEEDYSKLSDEELLDISDSDDPNKSTIDQEGDVNKELQENKDYISL